MIARFCWITPLCLVGLLLASCGQEDRPDPAAAAKQPVLLADRTWPNVIIISIDSLRPDHLRCYGYPKETSPRIDQFASEGALFEMAISSAPWTLPAHACLFSGLCDSVHGCVDTDRRLHGTHYTLTERLRDTGYATVGFFASAYLHPVFGLGQGFDTYVDCTSYAQLSDQTAGESGTVESAAVWEAMCGDVTNPKVVEQVQGWLRQNTRRPFFMFIHMWDVHFDYVPPPPYDTMFDPDYTGNISGERFALDPKINKDVPKRDLEHLLALYDGEIAYSDAHFGRILDELAALELLDSSIIVVTSGHGTAFFEHDLKGHRNALYDELVRVPLIMRYPARIPGGRRYGQQVRMIDLLPTVVDLLGMPSPKLMGQSLAPLFVGGQREHGEEPAVSELLSLGQKLRSFRRPERKTVWHVEADGGMVYDLRADPGELAPLQGRDSPTVTEARKDTQWCLAFLKAFRERYPQSPRIAELPPQIIEQLKEFTDVSEEQPPEEPASVPAP